MNTHLRVTFILFEIKLLIAYYIDFLEEVPNFK